jgi:hypothetical protein
VGELRQRLGRKLEDGSQALCWLGRHFCKHAGAGDVVPRWRWRWVQTMVMGGGGLVAGAALWTRQSSKVVVSVV